MDIDWGLMVGICLVNNQKNHGESFSAFKHGARLNEVSFDEERSLPFGGCNLIVRHK